MLTAEQLAAVFVKLLKPYQIAPGDFGLDRESQERMSGIERAAGEIGKAIEAAEPGFSARLFLTSCGIVYVDDALGNV